LIHGSKEEKNENLIQYWKSLRDYHNDPEMLEIKAREFMEGEDEPIDLSEMSGVSRRKFLALLSASASFALAGCGLHPNLKEKIIPYNERPQGVKEGFANYYASTCGGCANACGTLVKTREGRPIKVDGNPDHPINAGKVCAKAQASVLNLYDPERLKEPQKNGSSVDWKAIDTDIISALKSSGSKEIALIANTITSPTTMKVFADLKNKYPGLKVYSYDLSDDSNLKNAWKKSYGTNSVPAIKLDQAKIILSLESDFLASEGSFIENARLYAKNRDVMNNPKGFNKLYCVEGTMSITGMSADYRVRLKPDLHLDFVKALLGEFGVSAGKGMTIKDFAQKHNVSAKILEHLVDDFRANKGKSLVIAGEKLPESVHLAVNALNNAIGANALFNWDNSSVTHLENSSNTELKNLIENMNSGKVGVVIHFGSNPVYHLPPALGYSAALAKVKVVVTMAEAMNETTAKSGYVLPLNTAFESWGDHQLRSGIYSLQQPVIHPLYNTREKEAMLLTWINGDSASYNQDLYHQYLMNRWKNEVAKEFSSGVDFTNFWNASLHDGVVLNSKQKGKEASFKPDSLANLTDTKAESGFSVIFEDGYYVGDGRFANNGWLQELPHPVSRVVWDNYAALSYATAKELDLDYGDLVEVKISDRSLTLPAFIQPGMADQVVSVQLGYGRSDSGTIADGVGFNAGTLLSKELGLSGRVLGGASVSKTGEKYMLVSTQEHHTLEPQTMMENLIKDIHLKRRIIQEATYDDFVNHKAHLHRHNPVNVSKPHEYKGVKWGMAIDLNKCTGCSACVASCNVENNLPIVGKDQVKKNREMQWLRIDRYYSGTPEEPKASLQVMLCQHCDNAPCEYVCPVNATTHSEDGINQMVYQRCVGTRYCSNNCPYKVRRFNFFHYRKEFKDGYYHTESTKLLQNPEVTPRRRGVMEKCTFCIQRIMEARQEAIKESRELKGTDVTVACQDACPSSAIQFGDVNDPSSIVSQATKHELAYYVLEDINTRPNITYLAKLRNVEKSESESHDHGSANKEEQHH